MDATLRQLEYAVAVADHGSFHAAARACHVTQPGLSAQIRQLEHQLGVTLFERSRRRVLLTRAGEEVVQRARWLLTGVVDLEQAARAVAQPLTGALCLGVIPTVAPYLLPVALPEVRRRHPRLVLRIHEAQTDALVAMLRAGELDVLLLALEADLAGLETFALFEDPFVAALPASHRLASRKELRESDLREEPVLLLSDGHCLRAQVLAVCESSGAAEAGDFRASSLATLVQMVAGGTGITLLPELAVRVEGATRDLAIVPFRKPAPARTVGLAWRPSSPRADEFRMLGALLVPGGAAADSPARDAADSPARDAADSPARAAAGARARAPASRRR
jgi:LysR family hydrogen peroxide-inducible transcriptional activator